MAFQIRFDDMPASPRVKHECEAFATQLREEFPDTSKVELSLSKTGGEGFEAHVHVTGKDIDLAGTAKQRDMLEAALEALERVRKQLRKHRDKLIDRHR